MTMMPTVTNNTTRLDELRPVESVRRRNGRAVVVAVAAPVRSGIAPHVVDLPSLTPGTRMAIQSIFATAFTAEAS